MSTFLKAMAIKNYHFIKDILEVVVALLEALGIKHLVLFIQMVKPKVVKLQFLEVLI